MTEPEPVTIEVTIAAKPEDVWAALRDPELIKRWHGWHFDGLDEEVSEIYLKAAADADTWTITAGGKDTFTLHPTETGVLVRITRPERGHDPEWDAYYDDITEGWTTFLTQLKFAMERHGLAERRTLFLSGGLTANLAELLNLPTDLATGQTYTAETAMGEKLDGEVYARSENQLMVTVNGWGDGLLILGEQPPAPHRPQPEAMIVATTYGLAEHTHQELEARWTTWWGTVKRDS